MATINDRLATLEAAVASITGSGTVTVITQVVESAEDAQQNARLASSEASIATLQADLASLSALLAIDIAALEADVADHEARLAVLEATSYGAEANAGIALAFATANAATVVPVISHVYAYAGYPAATGTAYAAQVSTGGEGVSTTETLPFRLGT